MVCAYFVHNHPFPGFPWFLSHIVHSKLLEYTNHQRREKGNGGGKMGELSTKKVMFY